MNTQAKDVLELNLLDFEEFEEEFEILENILPCPIHDEDYRQDLPTIIEEGPEDIAQMVGNFDLMIKVLENANNVEDVKNVVADLNVKVRDCYEENMKTVFEKTKPFEKTVRSLQLLYENAGVRPTVYLMPVNKAKFADAANPKHFNTMEYYLRQEFGKFQMEDSPFYITYIGDIGSTTAIQKMATIAMKTCALAVLDIKEVSTEKAAIEYAKKIAPLRKANSSGQVLIPATWGYKQGAKDISFIKKDEKYERREQKMSVPLASAIIGRLLGENPGIFITGLMAESLMGIDGVKIRYGIEKDDASTLDEAGLVMILNSGHIMGSSTFYKGGNSDLQKFAKVDIANALHKDLIQFCNDKAFSKWGKDELNAFKKELHNYFNRCYKRGVIGKGWEIKDPTYDPDTSNVEIKIKIPFSDVADGFEN